MNALRVPLSSATIGRSQPALAASVALHVAAALPLFLPMARPETEVTPPVVVELVMAAEEPVAAAPSAVMAPPTLTPTPAPPRPTSARVQSTPRSPVSKPVPASPATAASDGAAAPQDTTPPPTEVGTADGAAAMAGAGTRGPETGNGGGTTGKEGEVSAPGYTLGTAHTPAPDYPWSARRRGVEGRVVLRLEVGADGRPTGVELVHGSGHDVLDQAAINTVWHWRLRPAMAGGVAVAGRVVVPIVFKLT